MATSREERMQQRMRGAGRHEVGNDSFGFVLPVAEPSSEASVEASVEPPAESSPSMPQMRPEPNSSAKRRRLNNQPTSASRQSSSSPAFSTRSSSRLSNGQRSARLNTIRREAAQGPDAPRLNSPPTTMRISTRLKTLNLNQDGTPRGDANGEPSEAVDTTMTGVEDPEVAEDAEDVVMESLPDPTPQQAMRESGLSSASRISDEPMLDLMEEVMESPVAAPGSGRRRRIVQTESITRSAKLQKMVMEEEAAGLDDEVATSSPLARKSMTNNAIRVSLSASAARARAGKTSLPHSLGTVPESSPRASLSRKNDSPPVLSSARSTRSQNRRSALSTVISNAEMPSSPLDAQRTSSPIKSTPKQVQADIPRKSPYEIVGSEEESLEPVPGADGAGAGDDGADDESADDEGADGEGADNEEAEEINDREAATRIGGKRLRTSPRQKQPPDVTNSPIAEAERPAKRKRSRPEKASPAKQAQPRVVKRKKKPLARRKSDGDSIPITVQRYTRPLRRNPDDTDEDILNTDIPFTDHKSPNVVDVVLQICEESIEKYLFTLQEEANQADESASRKILRTKLRAVEAFQEELRTRLQAQTIALDNLRTLKKRVRAAQKEKITLRNEIMRIRAEREQVALKIDTVRMRHETANKETLNQLGLSSTMDDIELAVENGKMAPEPNAKEKKTAELANLDLRISQIANQVSEGGGTLRRIKEFNMLLERAAAALEGR